MYYIFCPYCSQYVCYNDFGSRCGCWTSNVEVKEKLIKYDKYVDLYTKHDWYFDDKKQYNKWPIYIFYNKIYN